VFPAKRPVASALCKADRSLSIYFAAAFLCPRLSAVSAIGDHKGNFASVCSVKCQLLVILVPSDSRTNGSFLRHGLLIDCHRKRSAAGRHVAGCGRVHALNEEGESY